MKKVDWVTSLFLFLTPLATVVFVPWYIVTQGWHWSLFIAFIIYWGMTEMAITAGYHRFMAHRSYDVKPWLKIFYLLVGAAAFQGSAMKWGTDHRRHHRFVDTDKDPYNIKRGFWYAHLGWLLVETEEEYKDKFAPDLENDLLINLQHKYYVPLAIGMGFGLPLLIGTLLGMPWGGLVFAGLLRVVLAHHCTFFINSLCHTLGRQPYSTSHSARDSGIVAFLTFGEGYHNFHHEFQIDYRNGVRWYQWDPTKWFIKVNALIGWATKLKKIPKDTIIRAVVIQEADRLASKGAQTTRLEELKLQVFKAQDDLKRLHQEWLRVKDEFAKSSRDRFIQLKSDIKMTRLEFRKAHSQWKLYVKTQKALSKYQLT